jgi:hypothetical protein
MTTVAIPGDDGKARHHNTVRRMSRHGMGT